MSHLNNHNLNNHNLNNHKKKVLILTTCDGVRYKPMIDVTEDLHKKYASKHGYEYARVDGVVRGFKPWHATFNRIYLLQSLLAQNIGQNIGQNNGQNNGSSSTPQYDWVLYMDADAVIIDFDKRLDEFLDDNYAIVACRGSVDDPEVTWNLNIGVCFFNLRHPQIAQIINIWHNLYENVPDHVLQGEREGVFDDLCAHVNDQDMLCLILYQEQYRGLAKVYRGSDHNKFNYSGNFIRQVLRDGKKNTVDSRVEQLRALVDATKSSIINQKTSTVVSESSSKTRVLKYSNLL